MKLKNSANAQNIALYMEPLIQQIQPPHSAEKNQRMVVWVDKQRP